MIRTQRLKLCPWRDEHRAAFAEMHADPEVMADQGGPVDQAKCSGAQSKCGGRAIKDGF